MFRIVLCSCKGKQNKGLGGFTYKATTFYVGWHFSCSKYPHTYTQNWIKWSAGPKVFLKKQNSSKHNPDQVQEVFNISFSE